MKSNTRKVELASVDDLFSIEKSRQDAVREKKMNIPITKLYKETFDLFAQKNDDFDDKIKLSIQRNIPLESILLPYGLYIRTCSPPIIELLCHYNHGLKQYNL